jgi:hypothetical protein
LLASRHDVFGFAGLSPPVLWVVTVMATVAPASALAMTTSLSWVICSTNGVSDVLLTRTPDPVGVTKSPP